MSKIEKKKKKVNEYTCDTGGRAKTFVHNRNVNSILVIGYWLKLETVIGLLGY
jgi:hypothetical protein